MNGAKRAFPFLILNKCKCLRESRKRQKVSRGTCGTPASAKKFPEALAGLPQTPKSFPGDLRDSRKHFEEVSGLCSVSAKVLFPILVFAGLLQERFSSFWCLQDSCKGAFPHFGVCRTSARTHFSILAFAILSPSMLRRSAATQGRIGAEASAKSVYFCPYFIR